MRINYKDSAATYTHFSYDSHSNSFVLSSDDGDELLCQMELQLLPDYDPQQYEKHFFYNVSSKYSENSIFQVYVDEQRIGWIFPIQALFSSEHDYAKDEHFLKYAYVAINKLLEDLKINENKQPDEFILPDCFDPSLCLLILCKDNCSHIAEFDIMNYIASLYSYGYTMIKCEEFNEVRVRQGKQLRIKSISKELINTTYLQLLFTSILPAIKKENEVTKFLFIYQIIEILISKVFDDEFVKILSEIGGENTNLFDIKDKILNITSEDRRISWLFSNYFTITDSQNRAMLEDACKKLLQHHSRKVSTDYLKNLYAVRCFLVHNLYGLDIENSLSVLADVNNAFLLLMIDALIEYKRPQQFSTPQST